MLSSHINVLTVSIPLLGVCSTVSPFLHWTTRAPLIELKTIPGMLRFPNNWQSEFLLTMAELDFSKRNIPSNFA